MVISLSDIYRYYFEPTYGALKIIGNSAELLLAFTISLLHTGGLHTSHLLIADDAREEVARCR